MERRLQMKNKLAAFLFWFFFLGVFFTPFLTSCSYIFEDMQINPFDYSRITDVEYKAVVVDEPDSEGKVMITERLTFDIHAASKNNLFWELWRDLPEDYIDGVKVDYKVHSVKQILEDGTEIVYEIRLLSTKNTGNASSSISICVSSFAPHANPILIA